MPDRPLLETLLSEVYATYEAYQTAIGEGKAWSELEPLRKDYLAAHQKWTLARVNLEENRCR